MEIGFVNCEGITNVSQAVLSSSLADVMGQSNDNENNETQSDIPSGRRPSHQTPAFKTQRSRLERTDSQQRGRLERMDSHTKSL